ncbi:lipopolysaccharide biosynthesis protein [Spongiactinospora sp. TRM90649]|uniref:lipopolysaccharide biosynthesis protein n=1 Tax=Spongiactinospora sp. TRM90649 TaxID=3031114 RepID=UPI0023FA35DF|nr:lipopolysaccharide biosynthesis protein [Spongiactinospora sp. TRM90649]MDF5754805.1 lipopolysaccharide biosynthesis protein [Spongiactinospora sp. TRM90649]
MAGGAHAVLAPVTVSAAPSLGAVARGGALGLAGAGAGAAAQVALVVVVSRAVPPATAGALFTAMALSLMVAGIVRLDAGNGLVHALARHTDQADVSAYIRAALLPVLALAVLTSATIHLLGPAVAAATGIPVPWVRLLALAVPFIACADVLVAATRGLGAMGPTTYLSGLLQPLGQLTLTVIAVLLTAPAVGTSAIPTVEPPATHAVETNSTRAIETHIAPAIETPATTTVDANAARAVEASVALPLAWALPYVPVLVLAALWLRRRVPRGAVRRPGAAGELWRHTAPRAGAGAIQAVFQRLDIVIVAVLGGPAEAACYTAATRFKVVGQLAAQGLAHAAQPRLVRALAAGDLPGARRLYQATTLWLVTLTWPMWAGYAALAPLLPRFFGTGYERGVQVAAVLAGTMMIASACGMVDIVLTAAGHTTASLANTAAAVAVTVAADLALVPEHGAVGAALGWSAGVLVKNLLPLLHLHHRYGLRPFGRHSATALRPRTWRGDTP